MVTATTILVRLADGLGFRYHWATKGLRDEDYEYQPSPDSMSMRQLLGHIYGLVNWFLQSLGEETQPLPEAPGLQEIRGFTLDKISRIRSRLLETSPEQLVKLRIRNRGGEYPFWNMINGPLSDALTHVGQVNSWRRLNGNPVPAHNVFLGRPARE
jgi:hypothetical protein